LKKIGKKKLRLRSQERNRFDQTRRGEVKKVTVSRANNLRRITSCARAKEIISKENKV
jgi:hypothetical protein